MTKKEIKGYIANGAAVDITNYSHSEIQELYKRIEKDIIGVSTGIYGMTGALIKDRKTGDLYAITARNSNLFYMV